MKTIRYITNVGEQKGIKTFKSSLPLAYHAVIAIKMEHPNVVLEVGKQSYMLSIFPMKRGDLFGPYKPPVTVYGDEDALLKLSESFNVPDWRLTSVQPIENKEQISRELGELLLTAHSGKNYSEGDSQEVDFD